MEIYLEGDVWVTISPEVTTRFLSALGDAGVDLSHWERRGIADVDAIRRELNASGHPVRAFLEAYDFEFTEAEPADDGAETLEFSWMGMWRSHEDLLKFLTRCGALVEGEVFDPDADDPDEPYLAWD